MLTLLLDISFFFHRLQFFIVYIYHMQYIRKEKNLHILKKNWRAKTATLGVI